MKDKPMILSITVVQNFPNDSICRKINTAIPDASVIVSIVHDRQEDGTLWATVYYRG